MNERMWLHPAVQNNVALLRSWGQHFLGPEYGSFGSSGEGEGLGRMAEPPEIAAAAWALLHPIPQDLRGLKVVVSAGPTREYLDPVRFISNPSSGKMGFAVAQAARDRGARVTLVSGPTLLPTPPGVARIDVTSAAQMATAVDANLAGVDAFIAVAAVADYTPTQPAANKLKKTAAPLTITLQPTVDILAAVAARSDAPYCVGFAAETNDVAHNADKKRRRKKLPLIIANRAQDAFGSDENDAIPARRCNQLSEDRKSAWASNDR